MRTGQALLELEGTTLIVNNNIDLSKLSDRVLISLVAGLNQLWEREATERKNGYYPDSANGDTTAADLDLADALIEALYDRGNGGHRFCSRHLLPLLSPDYCEGCTEYHVNNNEEN
jgi:hypothetical protein